LLVGFIPSYRRISKHASGLVPEENPTQKGKDPLPGGRDIRRPDSGVGNAIGINSGGERATSGSKL
jgi:hypothetical protein